MTAEEYGLLSLLIFLLTAGAILALASGMTLGRKLADLSYQRATGINGINRVQSVINIRTHANRIQLGLLFVIVSVLSLLEVSPVIQAWVARVLFSWVLICYAASSLLDWRDDDRIMRMQLTEQAAARVVREASLTEAEGRRAADTDEALESYRQIASEAVECLESATNVLRETQGKPPIEPLPAVAPEHSSPVSGRQVETARIATLRARAAAAARALDPPPLPGGGGEAL